MPEGKYETMLELCLSLRSLLVLPLISVGMMQGKMGSRWCQRSRNIFSQGFLHGKLLTLLKRVRGCTWIRETNVYYFAGQLAFNENDFQMCWLGAPLLYLWAGVSCCGMSEERWRFWCCFWAGKDAGKLLFRSRPQRKSRGKLASGFIFSLHCATIGG